MLDVGVQKVLQALQALTSRCPKRCWKKKGMRSIQLRNKQGFDAGVPVFESKCIWSYCERVGLLHKVMLSGGAPIECFAWRINARQRWRKCCGIAMSRERALRCSMVSADSGNPCSNHETATVGQYGVGQASAVKTVASNGNAVMWVCFSVARRTRSSAACQGISSSGSKGMKFDCSENHRMSSPVAQPQPCSCA